MNTDTIEAAYSQAMGKWSGCDWPTQFGAQGLNLNGLRARHASLLARATSGAEAETWRAAAGWLEQVEQDAQEAEEAARTAVELTQAAKLQEALAYARRADELESRYGAHRVWQPLYQALEAALSPAPTPEPERASPGSSSQEGKRTYQPRGT